MNPQSHVFSAGSLRLAARIAGQGRPVVVLESGLLAESEAWEPVARGISGFARVLWYDRAGRGASSPGLGPRTAGKIAEELRALLDSAGLAGPYILAGHSLGGLIVRLFAWRYPHDTAGLVLVDPTHEDQFETIAALLPPATPEDSPALRRLRDFWTAGYRNPEANLEGVDFPASCAQARAIDSFGNLPVRLLAAGAGFKDLGLPAETAARLQAAMLDLHRRTMGQSSDGRLEIIPNSSHFIQRDHPQAVVRAARELVEQFQKRGRVS